MVPQSIFDDDITDIDSVNYNYGIQVPESSERETLGQWLPPSLTTLHTNNWRSPIGCSQNKYKDRPPQLFTKHWFGNDKYVDLPDGHRTLANITGRSYGEAFKDLGRLPMHRPPESSQRTPSIASDDSHSSDSPNICTPSNFIKDLSLSPKLVNEVESRLASSLSSDDSHLPIISTPKNLAKDLSLSPKPISGVAQASFQLAFRSIEVGSTTTSSQRDDINVSVPQSSASPDVSRKDVTKPVESPVVYCTPKTFVSYSRASPRLRHSSRNSDLAFSHCTVQEPDASTTQSSFPQPPCVAQPSSSKGDLIDSAKNFDTYLPESKPASGSGTKAKKLSKPSSPKFECPHCSRRFTRNFDMKRHMDTIHLTQTTETIDALTCTCCGENLSRKDAFMRHIKKVPNSCIRAAQLKQKPPPTRLSDETYATHKAAMMEVWKRQSSRS